MVMEVLALGRKLQTETFAVYQYIDTIHLHEEKYVSWAGQKMSAIIEAYKNLSELK